MQPSTIPVGNGRSPTSSGPGLEVGFRHAAYLADWRLTPVQATLHDGRSVKQLADELGYAGASALSRLFSQRVGQSPRQWLAQVEAVHHA